MSTKRSCIITSHLTSNWSTKTYSNTHPSLECIWNRCFRRSTPYAPTAIINDTTINPTVSPVMAFGLIVIKVTLGPTTAPTTTSPSLSQWSIVGQKIAPMLDWKTKVTHVFSKRYLLRFHLLKIIPYGCFHRWLKDKYKSYRDCYNIIFAKLKCVVFYQVSYQV